MDITIRKVQAHQHIGECVQFNNQTLPVILKWFLDSKDLDMSIKWHENGYLELFLTHAINGYPFCGKATEGDYVVYGKRHLKIVSSLHFDTVYQWVEE